MPAKTSNATTWYRQPPPPSSPRFPRTSRTPSSNVPSSPSLCRSSKVSSFSLPNSPLASKSSPSGGPPSGSVAKTPTSNFSPSNNVSKDPASNASSPVIAAKTPTSSSNVSRAPTSINSPSVAGAKTPASNTPTSPHPSRATMNHLSPRATSSNPLASPRVSRKLASPLQTVPHSRHLPQISGPLPIPGAKTPTTSLSTSPSRLPTSTSISMSSSPKQSALGSKVASPTRQRNAERSNDRLPPVTKTPTSPCADQAFKLISKEPKTKFKEVKLPKEKINESKKSTDVPTKPEERKKEKPSGDKTKVTDISKKASDVKLEPKVIPKRKKTERSNSDTEIKPKKMIIKERHLSPNKLEESPEINTSTVRLPKTQSLEKGIKPSSKTIRRPTTLKLPSRNRPMQNQKRQQITTVEQRMRSMDLGGGCYTECQNKAGELEDNEADMKTPEVEMDIEGSDELVNIDAIEEVTRMTYIEAVDDSEDLTTDDIDLLSSDAGTYSLDFIPSSNSMENRLLTDIDSIGQCESIEMILSSVFDDEPKMYVDQKGTGNHQIHGHISKTMAANPIDEASQDWRVPSVEASICPQNSRTGEQGIQAMGEVVHSSITLSIEESTCQSDQYGGFRTTLPIDGSTHQSNQTNEDHTRHIEDTMTTPDSLMIIEKTESPAEDSTMQGINSLTKDEEETNPTLEDLPIDDHSFLPSGAGKEHMSNGEIIQNRGNCKDNQIPRNGSDPKSLVTSGAKESRRKARPNEIKRDVAPRAAKVSDVRLRDTSTARVTEARKANKKTKEEEMAKVSERRSKRKIDTERTRGGTKKSARLFVEKDVDKPSVPPPSSSTSHPRPASPCLSDVSSSSGQSQASSSVSHVSSRLPVRALHVRGSIPARSGSVASLCSTASGGGGSRGSRDSRVNSARQNVSSGDKKRGEVVTAPPRRPRLDNIKSTIPKPGRMPPRNNTDPVKAARGGGVGRTPLVGHNGPAHHPQPTQQPTSDQLKRLEAEVAARVAEAREAAKEREEAGRGLEALTVLLHHLTTTYDPFSTPRLKAEVVRLSTQLTEARLNLDESSAALRRADEAAASREEQHEQETQQLHQNHQQEINLLQHHHKQEVDLALEKHRKDLSKFAEEQQSQREDVSRAHAAEMEQLEGEWHIKLDVQHEKHLCALQDLNTQHTHKVRELELSRRTRERGLEEANHRLEEEQEVLRQESNKLQETLLNDTDHRLLAVRKMCTSLKSEVDSLKTVVDMKNTEIHELRGQVVETERLGGELESARERVRALQAKTEDLQAQMEKRVQQERHLVNEHRTLLETYQRESNTNKRLSLENEELAWKLRQREEIMSTSMPSSTLDLVSRAGPPRFPEGAATPQAAPRSPRVAVRSPSGKISPSKCELKRRSRLGLSPEAGMEGEERLDEVSFESPPPSPCVKAVVEKSNSVSFILDLNDSQSDDSFLDLPPSPRPRPQRTASLSAADRPRTPTHIRRVIHNNRANSLNRNYIHGDAKLKDASRKPKEVNGKGKESHEKPKEYNGKSLEVNGRLNSRRTTSESSDAGSEVERISPTGLAWTVPVHSPKSPVKMGPHNGSPIRKRIEHHLLEDPDEDEYEETPTGTHQFIEVVGLTSSSEAASDSEISQCDIKEGSSSDSETESSDGEGHTQKGNHGHKSGPWCPKEGAGEAMITDELLKQYASEQISADGLPRSKRNGRRRLPSAPSSDSDENVTPHNEGTNDVSWSEDVDITSSSEIHEL